MNRHFFSLLLVVLPFAGFAQVGVGTNNVDASAKFQIESANKGFLQPRIALDSTTDITTIANPATGLMVFNTATAGSGATAITPGVHYFNGTRWVRMQASVVNAGTGTTVTGSGTIESPYVINSTGGGGSSPAVYVEGQFSSPFVPSGSPITRPTSTATVNGLTYTVAPAISCGTITLSPGKWAVHLDNFCQISGQNGWPRNPYPTSNSASFNMVYWLQNNPTVYNLDIYGGIVVSAITSNTAEGTLKFPPLDGGDVLFKGSASFIQPIVNGSSYHTGTFYINNTTGSDRTYYLFARERIILNEVFSIPTNAGPIYNFDFAGQFHPFNRFYATKID